MKMIAVKRNRLFLPFIAFLMLVLASLACMSSPEPTQPPQPPPAEPTQAPAEEATAPLKQQAPAQEGQIGIESVKLMKDNGSGEAGEEVQSFTPANRKMHFEIKTTSLLPAGSHIKWVFIAVDIPDGKNIEITTVKTDVLAANILSANLELPRDWPVGSYKADVYINDQLFKTIEYNVQ
jgi:hypothetical protein